MDLNAHVEGLRRQIAHVAETGGDEARALAERLIGGIESALRLMLLEALTAAADEITAELAPGSVEVRLRGRDPVFVVTPPPSDEGFNNGSPDLEAAAELPPLDDSDDGGRTSRINLRLPDALKAQVEQVASRERLSVNAWLVRAVEAAVRARQVTPTPTPSSKGAQQFIGWVR